MLPYGRKFSTYHEYLADIFVSRRIRRNRRNASKMFPRITGISRIFFISRRIRRKRRNASEMFPRITGISRIFWFHAESAKFAEMRLNVSTYHIYIITFIYDIVSPNFRANTRDTLATFYFRRHDMTSLHPLADSLCNLRNPRE